MGEPIAIANTLASMPMPKKAMTQTTGRLRKIRLRPSKRDFFRAWTLKCASTSKFAGLEVTTAASAAASLRSESDRHGRRIADRDQIGISDRLRRNTQRKVRRSFGKLCV